MPTISLHDMITNMTIGGMVTTCFFHRVDGKHFHALHMIFRQCCQFSTYVASVILEDCYLLCVESNDVIL